MSARGRGAPVRGVRSLGCIALFLLAGSCGSPIGPSEGELIPQLGDLDFAAVSPAVSYDLWELRESFGGVEHSVIGSGGAKARSEIDLDLLAAFDATTVPFGFGPGCLPGHCFYYFAALAGAEIVTARLAGEVADFLGAIGSPEEAALVASAHGYHWGSERETSSVEPVGDGYELVVLQTIEFCDPVRVDRFRLRVSASGDLSVLASEVWEREEGVCI